MSRNDGMTRPVGRPRKSADDKLIQVKVWMKPATRDAIKAAAAAEKMSFSRWVVGLAERELRKASIL